MATPRITLLAALLLVGCSEDQVASTSSQVSTSESDDSTGDEAESTSDEAESSSSSEGSSSSSEGSSTSSGEAESTGAESTGDPVDPDPQPGAGHMWGRCTENSMLQCPAMSCMIFDDWSSGFCTRDCNTVKDCVYSGEPIISAADPVCAPVSKLTFKFCLLACSDSAECPVGMECTQLPNIPEGEPVQTVCA